MQEDSDFMVCVDESGEEFTVEIIQYVNENGQDYVVVAEVIDEDECDDEDCEDEDCDCLERPLHVMQVNPINDEEDEYLPVDEATEIRILEILSASAEMEWDDDEDDDSGEDDNGSEDDKS